MHTLKSKFIQSFLIAITTLVLAKIFYIVFSLGTFIDLIYLPVISLFVSAVIVTKQLIHETKMELNIK
jgi:hypothetical protein